MTSHVRRDSQFGNKQVMPDGYVKGVDDFPTPPWATRAFFKYVAPELIQRKPNILEPACGRGHMLNVVREYKINVRGSDIHDYGAGFRTADYTDPIVKFAAYDVMLTNPPFKIGLQFALRGLNEARLGVGLLIRTLWLEGGKDHPKSRWNLLFKHKPPNRVFIFSGRMPAVAGKVIRNRPVFMSHSWLYWDGTKNRNSIEWIPPEAQRLLERSNDYD